MRHKNRYITFMGTLLTSIKCTVAAFACFSLMTGAATAQGAQVDDLLADLQEAGEEDHADLAARIVSQWEKSGSAAMDLLYRRGTDALENNELDAAVEHLTALLDHAPEFAEGYHARASAYFALGYVGPALADLQDALRLEPRHFEAVFGLGAVLEALERTEDALEVYQEVLKIYPRDPDALEAIERIELTLRGQSL